MRLNHPLLLAVLLLLQWPIAAMADVGNVGPWGDQGDGTYKNPVLPCDYSDLDAVRVGEEYYAISSTFQFSPGVIVLRSRDLVSWTICGHAVTDLTQISPELNWDRMNRYAAGVWAGAIRHHQGKFWIYFGTPDEGFFMTTATDPAGPWAPLKQVMGAKGWDDCCPFWDDDGQGYFICTNFKDGYKIHLFKLSPDGTALLPESDRVLHQSRGSEANKLYKINGIYYHYYSEVQREGRVVMMKRAASLDGPWETRQLIHVNKQADREPNQGAILQAPGGSWWFLTHQGTASWEGRTMSLLPVTWTAGWPVMGRIGDDGIGNMLWSAKKPVDGLLTTVPQTSDEFDAATLPPQWEWNYQPRADKWSLTERPGHLRLHAFRPLKADTLLKAGNTLTQRCFRAGECVATIKLDLGAMTDGQHAGFCHFSRDFATIGIRQTGGVRRLIRSEIGKPAVDGPVVTSTDIWLRSTWGQDGLSQFAFSLDGTTFTPLGSTYQLKWGYYRGDRLGIFCYNDEADRGSVDVDWFHFDFKGPHTH